MCAGTVGKQELGVVYIKTPSQSSLFVGQFVTVNRVAVLPHPVKSPDLALRHFPVPKVEYRPERTSFLKYDKIQQILQRQLHTISQNMFPGSIQTVAETVGTVRCKQGGGSSLKQTCIMFYCGNEVCITKVLFFFLTGHVGMNHFLFNTLYSKNMVCYWTLEGHECPCMVFFSHVTRVLLVHSLNMPSLSYGQQHSHYSVDIIVHVSFLQCVSILNILIFILLCGSCL